MSGQETVSTTSRVARTSKVNIEDTRFSVDGVIAEMIIEVDENTDNSDQGPNKELISSHPMLDIGKSFFGMNSTNSDLTKMAFAQRLGLSTISADSDDTTTASEPDLRGVSMEDVEGEEDVSYRKSEHSTAQVHQKQKDDVSSKSDRVNVAERKHLRSRIVKQPEEKKLDVSTIKNKQPKVLLKRLPSDAHLGFIAKMQPVVELSSGSINVDSGTLGSITAIHDRIMNDDKQNIKHLFRVMYCQRLPMDFNIVRSRVLQFSNFPFEENSFPYTKRKKLMKTLPDNALQNMCKILGVKRGPKNGMINNILKFLMKPSRTPDPSTDTVYQPVVLLKKLDSDSIKVICEKLKNKQRSEKGRKSLSTKSSERESQKSSGLKNKSHGPSIPKKITKDSSVSQKKSKSIPMKKKISASVSRKTVPEVKRKVGRPKLHKAPVHAPHPQKKTKPPSLPSVSTVLKRKPGRPPGVHIVPEALKTKPGRPIRVQSHKYKKNLHLKRLQKGANRNFITKDKSIPQQKTKILSKTNISEKRLSLRKGSSAVVKKEENTETPVPSSRKRPASEMQRRTPEKRRKPVHYGEWLNEESAEILINEGAESKPTKVIKHELVIEDEENEEIGDEQLSETEEIFNSDEYITKKEDEVEEPASEPSSATVNSEQLLNEPLKGKGKGEKLGSFRQIAKNLESVTNCVLQRLHVSLFGTSLKAEEMKKNILNFDGFPFERDSEEWQEKHFFLSLSSCINLVEIFEVLNIEISDASAPAMVNTLMDFLLCPRKELLNKSSIIEEDAIKPSSSKVTDDAKKPSSGTDKKNVKKKIETKKSATSNKKKKSDIKPKPRKVLMDEATVRKLELEIAREQRARRRASLQPTNIFKPNLAVATPPSQQQLSIRTVLPKPSTTHKTPGIPPQRQLLIPDDVSPLPDGHKVTLEDNAHVKFMIFTLNNSDLDVLHHLIFLHGAVKTRVRRNLAEFNGFPFDETSPRYEVRKTVLRRLGYQLVKRMAFILGVAPLDTDASLEELSDLIMHFLQRPSRVKHVSVKQFPDNFMYSPVQDFDMKAVFSGIPNLSHVLREEGLSHLLQSGPVVKAVGGTKTKSRVTPEKSKSSSEPIISIAEVITSDPIKINGISGSSPKKQQLGKLNPAAQRTLSPVKGQSSAQNIIFQIVPNKPVSAAGSKVQLVPAPVSSHNFMQETPPPPPLQIADSATDVNESEEAPTVLPPLVRMPETQDKSPPQIPSLPPGQAFLLDPKKLMVMTKGLNKNSAQFNVSSSEKAGKQTLKDSLMKKLPLIAKIKTQRESQHCVLKLKSPDAQNFPLTESSQHTVISQKSVTNSELRQIINLPKSQTQFFTPSKSSSQPVLSQKLLLTQSQPQTSILVKSPPVQFRNLSDTALKSVTSESKGLILKKSTSGQSVQGTGFQKVSTVSQPQTALLTTVSTNTSQPLLVVNPSQSIVTSSTSDKTVDLAKRLLNLPQFQTMRAPSSDTAEELVLHQKNSNGKEEKITLFRLPPGHPLLPVIEAGKLEHPLNVKPLQSSAPAVLSVKPSDSTILSDSGYKSLFSTGLPLNSGVTQQSEKVSHEKHSDTEVIELLDPSDDELFIRIRDIIHAANLEDLTLKKINEKLVNEYPGLDISTRRPFIKSSVKNIICGMTSSSTSS